MAKNVAPMFGGPLRFTNSVQIPAEVATCPECGGALTARSHAYDEDTAIAMAECLEIDCERESAGQYHRWWQSDWQPVIDVIRKWTGASIE